LKRRKTKIALILVLVLYIGAPMVIWPRVAAQDDWHFSVTLSAPTNNPARIAHAGIIGDSLRRFNIDADLTLMEWGTYLSRIFFAPAENVGKTFDEGWMDIAFIGWSLSITPDPTSLYHSDAITPNSFNYGAWNNSENDRLIEAMLVETDDTARNELLVEWMENFNEEVPKAILYYPESALVYDPDIVNFEETSYFTPSPTNYWYPDGGGVCRVGMNADPVEYSPLMSTAYYDYVAMGSCFEGLRTYITNEDLFSYSDSPALAESVDVSSDGLVWTYNLRNDVYWPTGHKFTAQDVALSWKAIMTPTLGIPEYADFVAAGLDNDSISIEDDYTITMTFEEPYAWAKFALNRAPMPYDAFEEQGLVPLSDPDKAALWLTHGHNTGEMWTTKDVNDADYDVYGPLGLGPFRAHDEGTGWNPDTRAFTLKRWDKSSGLTNGTVVPYYMDNDDMGTTGHGDEDMFETWVVSTVGSADAALTALQNDEIDVIDSQFQLMDKLELVEPSWGSVLTQIELGLQEFSFNMQHPIFGTGEETPNGIDDPDNAALYAKYVRQAINHMIPRQAIIDQILNGYGQPGVTFISPVLAAYDPSIAPYEYDPDQAQELLEMAGYTVPTTTAPPPTLLYITGGVAIAAVVIAVVAIWKWKSK
jgi:ABC-type transport system substrate-binding protein